MGWLLDTKQLTLKDLGYAIENAWDERVRQAAITLNLAQLKQTLETPAPSAGFLNVIDSKERSYAERRQLAFSFIQGVLIGATFSGSVAIVIHTLTSSQKPIVQTISSFTAIPSGWGILLLLIVVLLGLGLGKLFLLFLDHILNRLEKK